MMDFQISNLGVNAEIDALTALLNGGWLDIYDGTKPPSADMPAGKDCHVLASLQFADPAFTPGVEGTAVSNQIDPDTNAAQEGAATWYRLTKADHLTVVADGTVGRANANLLVNAPRIQQYAEVAIDSFTLVANKAS